MAASKVKQKSGPSELTFGHMESFSNLHSSSRFLA